MGHGFDARVRASALALALSASLAACGGVLRVPTSQASTALPVMRVLIEESKHEVEGLSGAQLYHETLSVPCGNSSGGGKRDANVLQLDYYVPISTPRDPALTNRFEKYWNMRGWHVIYRTSIEGEIIVSMGDSRGYGILIMTTAKRAYITASSPCVAGASKVVRP